MASLPHQCTLTSLDPRPSWPCEEGSGELPRSEVSCWNAKAFKSGKLLSRILNVLFQSSNLHVLQYTHFLSLVELKRWLTNVTFFPSSTPTTGFQHSRLFRVRFFTTPSHGQKGLGSRLTLTAQSSAQDNSEQDVSQILPCLVRKVWSPEHSCSYTAGCMHVNKIENKSLPLWLHLHQYYGKCNLPVILSVNCRNL